MDSKGQSSRPTVRSIEHHVPNNDGWLLYLKQTWDSATLRPDRRPLVIIPGYGMNSFVFGFHPTGDSMEQCFAQAGYEVWSVDLRWQGKSRPLTKKPSPPSIRDFADADVPAALDFVLGHTRTAATQTTLVGVSLGGTVSYVYMATSPEDRVGAVIAMGSPLRWIHVPKLVQLAMFSPSLLRFVPTKGSQKMAGLALPIAARIPFALNMYVNPANVDLSAAKEFAKTVSDPHPALNVEIARWIKNADLELHGINVTEALRAMTKPLLLVSANRDGIVPPATARFPRTIWGGDPVDELIVGNEQQWYSHADMFIGNDAKRDVFDPVLEWLDTHG